MAKSESPGTRSKLINLPPLPSDRARMPEAKAIFGAHADVIVHGWADRQNSPKGKYAESPNAWFKREAYALISHYVAYDLADVFRRFVRQDRRSNRVIEEALMNPFKLGLLAMFADDSDLGRNNRRVFGNQMLYAWAHDVPPEFLNGFLAVSGGPAEIAEKLRCGTFEPGFEKRFRPERMELLGES